jgi:serine-type D-Ala-D-Ala carboxypeptidase/endopeptidase (penicillin-binding protein 4)
VRPPGAQPPVRPSQSVGYPTPENGQPTPPGSHPARPGSQPGSLSPSGPLGGQPGPYPAGGRPGAQPAANPAGGRAGAQAGGYGDGSAGGLLPGYAGAAADGDEDGEPEHYAGGQPGGHPDRQGGYGGAAAAGRAPVQPGGAAAAGRAGVQPGGPATAGTGRPAGADRTGRSRIRTLWVSGLAVLILIAGIVFVARPGPVDGWLSAGPDATPSARVTPEPIPTPVLAAAEGGGTAPTAAGVKAAIEPLVTAKGLGTKVNVSVVDAATGAVLYERNPDTMTTPASTTKLLTAAAVLAARGPAYRLTTRAVAGSKPGEVVLVGGGDPTLAVNSVGQFPGAARLDKLAAQVKKALGTTKPSRVLIDTSLYSGKATAVGWDPSDIAPGGQVAAIQSLMTNAGRITPVHHEVGADPRFSDPAIAAGKAFARQLGVTAAVTRAKAPPTAGTGASAAPDALAPGTPLGAVQSPPLVQVIDWMLQQSDNVIAEAMGRQVALAAGKPATFDGATDAIVAKLTELGLPGDEADLYDASGLSRHNGISPTLLTDVLTLAAGGRQPALASLFGGLPVAGWSGTLANRFATPSGDQVGRGVVRAKTGTLSGVNAMAGDLVTRDGRLLVFAIMASGSKNASQAKQAIDKIPARLVECGC